VMTNPFVKSPLIADTILKEPPGFEQVAFAVPDVGEFYIVGIRQIPPEVLAHMPDDKHQKLLGHMTEQTLMDWRPLPQAPTTFEDKFITTHLGEGIVRIYLAPKGSLLISAKGRQPTAADTYDTLIAVLAIKRDNQHLFAIAEFDGMMNGLTGLHAPADNTKIASRLTDQIVSIFGTMRLGR
jgi:hypothetical protein